MEREERASLRIRGGQDNGLTIPLSGGAVILGRGPDNDVDVDDETVSRRHALISETPDGFVLRDLGSANGTYLDRDKIDHRDHQLRHGNRIRLAGSGVTFIFRQKGPTTVKMKSEPADVDSD